MGRMEFLCRVVYLRSEETWLKKERESRKSEPDGKGNFVSLRASRCHLCEVSYKVFSAICASAFFEHGLGGLQSRDIFLLLDVCICVCLGEC